MRLRRWKPVQTRHYRRHGAVDREKRQMMTCRACRSPTNLAIRIQTLLPSASTLRGGRLLQLHSAPSHRLALLQAYRARDPIGAALPRQKRCSRFQLRNKKERHKPQCTALQLTSALHKAGILVVAQPCHTRRALAHAVHGLVKNGRASILQTGSLWRRMSSPQSGPGWRRNLLRTAQCLGGALHCVSHNSQAAARQCKNRGVALPETRRP